MKIWWLIGAVLLGVAALSVYAAFQSPEFVWGFLGAMAVAAFQAVSPILTKRLPADKEAEWRASTRRADGDAEWQRKRRGAPPKG